ncbi:hypothetical protein LEP1GSC071_0041 [Leptospira santarosai str. JET]|nr:hypothetical protein LEP1GSC071_0041 [Leptospira santarosai str. JET]
MKNSKLMTKGKKMWLVKRKRKIDFLFETDSKRKKNDSFLNRKLEKPEENFLKPFLLLHFLKKAKL